MVSILLHLPPALAHRIDQERGTLPRTKMALKWLLAQAGLDAETPGSALRRGRPRKAVKIAVQQRQIPPDLKTLTVAPVSLRLANWQTLLKDVPDPLGYAEKLPNKRKCWLRKGPGILTRIRLAYQKGDPRLEYLKKNARYSCGEWRLTTEKADDFIRQFDLVDIQSFEDLKPLFVGWSIQMIEIGSSADAFVEARVDFNATLSAASDDPAVALGLTAWLEHCSRKPYRWYQATARVGELLPGTLICEPLRKQEISDALMPPFLRSHPATHRVKAPQEWCEAWKAIVLQGQETADGSIRPQPHTGCPGHRVGALLVPCLEAAADKSEPRLLRSEWDAAVKRAEQFGVTASVIPRPPSRLLTACDSRKVPGWEAAARGGHRLFEYQIEAVRFALDRDLRCLIADEMGLGKTASAIAAIHAAVVQRALVVCPVNAIGVWQQEIAAWSSIRGPAPKVVVIRATDDVPALDDAQRVIVGYEILAGRDERIEINEERIKDALHAFLTKAYGKGPSQRNDGWRVKDIAEDSTSGKGTGAGEGRRGLWRFALEPNAKAASRMRKQLSLDHSTWMSAALRDRIERMAARLERPVIRSLQSWNPELVVVDEAHRAKGVHTRRTQAVREICAARQVLLLTGTPLRNNAEDGRALLEILTPDGEWNDLKPHDPRVKLMVKKALSWSMIRRLKKDVLKELPPKLRQRIPVRVGAENLKAYAGAMRGAEECFAQTWLRTGSASKARKAALGLWTRARRELGLAKLETGAPVAYIKAAIESKGCVIVFAHHREVLEVLEKRLLELHIRVGRIDGGVKPAERKEVVRKFQKGETQVFLGSIHAAGEAITLTRAETVIFIELDWVPGVLMQAEDRGHRTGQKASSYHILHLVAEIVPPPKPVEIKQPLSLAEMVPEDCRRYEEEGTSSPALVAAMARAEEAHGRWEQYQSEMDEYEWLASMQNIEEHMIDALHSKVEHIDDVLGETSGAVVGNESSGDGLGRLAVATMKRVKDRQKTKDLPHDLCL